MADFTCHDFPGPALAAQQYRILHSHWLDALQSAPEELRHYVLERCTGATFPRFQLALSARRLRVDVHIEDDVVALVLSIDTPDGPFPLAYLSAHDVLTDDETLMREQAMRLDDAITAIRGVPW